MEYNFTDLVLLMGTNPLPNYVVGKYFISTNKKLKRIWVVHTSQTRDFALNLKKQFGDKCKNNLIQLNEESDPKQIATDLEDKLFPELKDKDVHLNYTGGTKVMSVHAYKTMFSELKGKVSFSYLDARHFKLLDDENGVVQADLRNLKEVSPSSEVILELHGYEKLRDKKIYYQRAIQNLQTIIQDGELDMIVKSFEINPNGGIPLDYLYKGNDLIYDKKQLIQKVGNNIVSVNNIVTKFVQGNPILESIFKNQAYIPANFPEGEDSWKVKLIVEFLAFAWLEQYVEFCLKNDQDIKNKCKTELNWDIINSKWKNKMKFEIDVLLLYGYQLTGISCTTSWNREKCKLKCFEILHRIRQIGGDEAKAVLICMMEGNYLTDLNKEMEINTGGSKNILVLGKEHLKKETLVKEIKDFIDFK